MMKITHKAASRMRLDQDKFFFRLSNSEQSLLILSKRKSSPTFVYHCRWDAKTPKERRKTLRKKEVTVWENVRGNGGGSTG